MGCRGSASGARLCPGAPTEPNPSNGGIHFSKQGHLPLQTEAMGRGSIPPPGSMFRAAGPQAATIEYAAALPSPAGGVLVVPRSVGASGTCTDVGIRDPRDKSTGRRGETAPRCPTMTDGSRAIMLFSGNARDQFQASRFFFISVMAHF